jgi:glutaredoxin 3
MQPTQICFKDWCPYSRRALRLLEEKGVDFNAIDVTSDPEREMRLCAGRTSVPQIFVGARHLGGFDDIAALDATGKLDPILNGELHQVA